MIDSKKLLKKNKSSIGSNEKDDLQYKYKVVEKLTMVPILISEFMVDDRNTENE